MAGKIVIVLNRAFESGKSWIAQNLTKNLAIFNRVLLIDLDPQGDSSKYFEVSQNYSLSNIFDKSKDVSEVVQKTSNKNLFVIPANIDLLDIINDNETDDKVVNLANYLNNKFDYIVIDTSPISTPLVKSWINVSNKIIYPLIVQSNSSYFLGNFLKEFDKIKDKIILVPLSFSQDFPKIYHELNNLYGSRFVKRNGDVVKFQIGEENIHQFNYLILSLRK